MAQMSAVFAELESATSGQSALQTPFASFVRAGRCMGRRRSGGRRDGDNLIPHASEQQRPCSHAQAQGQGQELQRR